MGSIQNELNGFLYKPTANHVSANEDPSTTQTNTWSGHTSEFCHSLPLGYLRMLSGRVFPPLDPSLLLIGFKCDGLPDFT